jgi:hydrogenase/urease accessory protein HupE
MKPLVTFLFWTILSTLLLAHQTGLSYLELEDQGDDTIAVTYKKPLEDLQATGITIHFPAGCTKVETDSLTIENGFATERYRLRCSRELRGERVWIEGLVASDKGVLFRFTNNEHTQKDLLRATHPFVQIGGNLSTLQLSLEYLSLGFTHILTGFDHLLFVLGLLFLASSTRALLWAISSFTLAHSITLALGIFGILDLSPPFVEAMIAASIVILYREIIVVGASGMKHLPAVVFLFGLLHGLGFSGALSDIGLPRAEIPQALLAFNIGIELGQILFVAIVSLALALLYRFFSFSRRTIELVISYGAGSLASFWLIQRVLAF